MQQTSRTTHRTADGTTLAVRTTLPDGPRRGIVQIVHGMAEHAARYDGVAATLADAGHVVVVYDQRGHGETSPDSRGHLADRGGWQLLVDDALEIGAAARAEHPDLPLVLLGHSMGSLVARTLVLGHSHAIDALVLSGTVADPGAARRLPALALAHALGRVFGPSRPSPTLDRLVNGGLNTQFAPGRTRFDWLSRDPAQVDAYVTDPACGFVCSNRFYVDLFTGIGIATDRRRAAGVRSDLPILLLAGDHDPVGDNGAGVAAAAAAYRRSGVRDVTTRLYSKGRHEMFNETCREEVLADLVRWLDEHVPETPHRPSADVIPLRRNGAGPSTA